MGQKKFERYQVYKSIMSDEQRWQKTLGIITCKILRERHEYKEQFNKVIDLLADSSFRDLVRTMDWHLALSGGTFASLPRYVKDFPEFKGRIHGLAPSALGVIQIANLAVYGHLFGVAFFNHMEDLYADSPQNLCLRRICNYCDTPLFEDLSSIEYIFRNWRMEYSVAKSKAKGFPAQRINEYYGKGEFEDAVLSGMDLEGKNRSDRSRETLAVVSHDERKMTMLNFCLEHMNKILTYRRVISTGTTGRFLREQLRVALEVFGDKFKDRTVEGWGWDRSAKTAEEFLEEKIKPLASGPEGGDVQISAKVIDGTCHRVLFFQDPESAHPHQFDIRMMEKAVQDPDTAALFATSTRMARMIV